MWRAGLACHLNPGLCPATGPLPARPGRAWGPGTVVTETYVTWLYQAPVPSRARARAARPHCRPEPRPGTRARQELLPLSFPAPTPSLITTNFPVQPSEPGKNFSPPPPPPLYPHPVPFSTMSVLFLPRPLLSLFIHFFLNLFALSIFPSRFCSPSFSFPFLFPGCIFLLFLCLFTRPSIENFLILFKFLESSLCPFQSACLTV